MTYKRPVREIASWPAWEVRLIERYLQKQPSAEERHEIALATLCALTFNVYRGKGQGAKQLKDFLPFLDPWPQLKPGRYSEVDLEMMRAIRKC